MLLRHKIREHGAGRTLALPDLDLLGESAAEEGQRLLHEMNGFDFGSAGFGSIFLRR